MANSISLIKKHVPLLDEVYKMASLTSILDGAPELAKAGANANELIIYKMKMQGMANYSRNSGYTQGDVTLEPETIRCDYDRGRMFQIDSLDDEESEGVAFGRLASEFIRMHVTPELDAYRFSKYAKFSGIGKAEANLADGKAVIAAVRAGINAMDEAEVSPEGRILFITPTLKGLVEDLDITASKKVFERFAQVVAVPQNRFYTSVDLEASGKGGYKKTPTSGKDINFMIIEKSAVIQFPKRVKPKIVTPEQNQNADAYKFGYRLVSVATAYENKAAGIYLHAATT